MEESEAYNNSTLTSEGDKSIIQVRIEETKNPIQKMGREKFEITQKLKDKTFNRNHMCNRLEWLNHHQVGIKDTVSRLRKELDILEVSKDKLHFAINAYQEKPINASFSKQQIDNHKVHYKMVHGTNNIAKEKQLLREIRADQDSPEDETSLSIEEIKYTTWWCHNSLRYEKDEKKAKDGLREIKQHEWERDRTIANATVKGKIWNSLGSKKDLQNQIKGLRTDLDESRKRHLEIRAKITSVKKELKGVDKEINFLKKQFADIEEFQLPSSGGGETGSEAIQAWCAPPEGWWKINTDAAFKGNRAALALVVRDHTGSLRGLASTICDCHSHHVAEVAAINWASEYAAKKGWRKLLWSSDDQRAVKEIVEKRDPSWWRTSYDILNIRSKFDSENWHINWNPRSCNALADSVAKFTFLNNCVLLFDDCKCDSIPTKFLSLARLEALG